MDTRSSAHGAGFGLLLFPKPNHPLWKEPIINHYFNGRHCAVYDTEEEAQARVEEHKNDPHCPWENSIVIPIAKDQRFVPRETSVMGGEVKEDGSG